MNCHYCRATNCKLWRRYGDAIVNEAQLICAHCINAKYDIALESIEKKYDEQTIFSYAIFIKAIVIDLMPAIINGKTERFCVDGHYPDNLWQEWKNLPINSSFYLPSRTITIESTMNCHYCHAINCKLWRQHGDHTLRAKLICAVCISQKLNNMSVEQIENKYANLDPKLKHGYYLFIPEFNRNIVPAILLNVHQGYIADNEYPLALWKQWLALPIYRFNLPPLLNEIS